MVQTEGIAHLLVKINGLAAPQDLMGDIISVEVHDSLRLPDMFIMRLRDPHLAWVNDQLCNPGNRVELLVPEGAEATPLIQGEITALNAEFLPVTGGGVQAGVFSGPTLTVRGYDLSHRLHRDRKTRSFVSHSPSDIVSKVGREAGLNIRVVSTRPQPYLLQSNQTDWEFLWQLAQRIGFRVFVRNEILHFTSDTDRDQVVDLDWGTTMSEFRVQLSTSGQVNEVIVRGWDLEGKREIVGRATRPDQSSDIGERRSGGQTALAAFGFTARAVQVDSPVSNQADADQMAQAILNQIAEAFIQAEGVAAGQPRLSAGTRVELTGVGSRFSGSYLVTECVHRYEVSGYTTRFSITGHRTGSLLEALRAPEPTNTGSVVGIVSNNKDPLGMGRVKVRFPWLSESDESDWARVVTPMAGGSRGFMFLPEVDDEVLVTFEHGDIHRPYIIGALWNGRDSPPLNQADAVDGTGQVVRRVIKSRAGHTILIDDGPSGGITIESEGDLSVTAEGKLILKGRQGVEIEGTSGNVDVKGTQIGLN